jgi:YidC/Oxa1 family membrane protein insertase
MSGIVLTAYDGAILGPIAKLLGLIMNWIYAAICYIFHVDNVPLGIVILIMTFLIYMCLLPLTIKQQKFSKLSQAMQPEIQAIQNKYKNKNDQASMQAMQQETQLVYEKYGVSPSGSCIQMLIQMPILFGLYRVFYNIPAYINSVYNNFSGLADDIIATGTDTYTGAFTELMSKDNGFNFSTSTGLTTSTVADKLSALAEQGETGITSLKNYIIDILYKLPSNGWGTVVDSSSNYVTVETAANASNVSVTTLPGHFAGLSDSISTAFENMRHFNYLFGMNISDTPWNIIRTSFSSHAYLYVILALLIPVLSYLTQLISLKMMPQASNGNDQMAQQMKTMNMMMPLMSLFICFTVPVGLGFYWVCSGAFRCIQQFFINRHIQNLNLDEVILQNQEKAKKKREKMGIAENQIRQAAAINTRTIENKAKVEKTSAEKELELEKANAKKANAKSGSLAAKANMVKEFNERNSRK